MIAMIVPPPALAQAALVDNAIKAVDIEPDEKPVAETGVTDAEESLDAAAPQSGNEQAAQDVQTPDTYARVESAYQDTEFGELLYNEASLPTKMEILRLLSKDTPSTMVFLHGLSMGLGIDDIVQAATRYQPEKGRDLSRAAVSILPLLSATEESIFPMYNVENLASSMDTMAVDFEQAKNTVGQVIERFFEEGEVLGPYPDWHAGQYHLQAFASELSELAKGSGVDWYHQPKGKSGAERPIFVSMYGWNKSVLIDGKERIAKALAENGSEAKLPVVFIFNRIRDRALDQLQELDYQLTVRGIQKAYSEQALCVTPAPEWERGDYHIMAQLEELSEIFAIPSQEDYEEDEWQALIQQAKRYKAEEISLIVAILSSGGDEQSALQTLDGQQLAQYADPAADAAT
ncbi:MAG: hypothetical protein KJP04_04305, partial [Arenicella sp.]|nr:hypothetical protein [Arenicella sp.]